MPSNDLFLIVCYRRWIFAAVGMLVVAAASLFLALAPRTYLATASVVVASGLAASAAQPQVSPPSTATLVDIVRSQRVARRAVALLELEKNPAAQQAYEQQTRGQGEPGFQQFYATRLLDRLTVTPREGSEVIEISVAASDPRIAAASANAVAAAFSEAERDLRRLPGHELSARLGAQAESLRSELERARQRLAGLAERTEGGQTGEIARLTQEVEVAEQALRQILQRLIQTRLDPQARPAGVVILDEATPPATHTGPNRIAVAVVTALLAPLIAMGACVLAELLDRRVRSERELGAILDVRVLGTLPRHRPVAP